MGLQMFSDETATLLLNVATASIAIGLVAVLARWGCRRASLPLRHGVVCASMLLMLISPLPVWIAVQLGFGLFTFPASAQEDVSTNDSFLILTHQGQEEASSQHSDALWNLQPAVALPREDIDFAVRNRGDSTQQSKAARKRAFWETSVEDGGATYSMLLRFGIQTLILIWGSVAIWRGVRLVRRVSAVRRLQQSLPVSSNVRLMEMAKRVFLATGLGQGVPVVESRLIPAPMTLGWFRPVLAMPQGLADSLDDEELASVYAHEVAHLVRRDQFIGLFQQIALAIFWWNPPLHSINVSIHQLRERLCDDFAALDQGGGTPLARAIVRVAEFSALRTPPSALSVALLDDFHDLEDRINRLTDPHRVISIRFSKTSVAALIAFCLLLLVPSIIPMLRAHVNEPDATTNVNLTIAAKDSKDEGDDEALTEEERQMKAKGIVLSAPIPISLSGSCRSPQDQPIAGATVYLVSMYRSIKPLAETKTDAEGRYRFQNVALPTIQYRNGSPSGMFQVIAEAEGYGIAWHGCRHYTSSARPADMPKDPQDFQFFRDEKIEMDLTMQAPKTLKGSIVDERGNPVANASILLRDLDYLKTAGREMHENFRQCRCIVLAPPDYCQTTTDAKGQFEFGRLPEGAVAFLNFEHPDHSDQWMYVAMTDEPITEYRYIANHHVQMHQPEGATAFQTIHTPIWETRSVVTSPLNVRMASVRRVTVNLVQENGTPAPAGSVVVATAGPIDQQISSAEETDIRGQVVLKLPPGEYEMRAEPPRTSDFRSSKTSLTVNAEPAEQSVTMELALGCVVIFEVVDAATGKGIPDVDFMEKFGNGTHQGISNETTRADDRGTDEQGQMRAVVFPGTRSYRIGYVEGYEFDFNDKVIECKPGTTGRIQFKLRKQKSVN